MPELTIEEAIQILKDNFVAETCLPDANLLYAEALRIAFTELEKLTTK